MGEVKRKGVIGRQLLIAALAILLLGLVLLWFITPSLVARQVESELLDAGFDLVTTETEGFGWQRVRIAHLDARSNHAKLEAEEMVFVYGLRGLLRRQARSLTIGSLTFSYTANEWPDRKDLEREFPFLIEERDLDEPPFAKRITVAQGEISLMIGTAFLLIEIGLDIEAHEPGEWDGNIDATGGGLEMVAGFHLNAIEEEGEIRVLELTLQVDELSRMIREFTDAEAFQAWNLSGETVQLEGEVHWQEGRYSLDLNGSSPHLTLDLEDFEELRISATLQLQGSAEEVEETWSLAMSTSIRAEVQTADFQDQLLLELAAGAYPLGEWTATLHLMADVAEVQLAYHGNPQRRHGTIEIQEAVLRPEFIRQMTAAVTAGERLRQWSIHSTPLLMTGTVDWEQERLSWALRASIHFADFGEPGTAIVLREFQVTGRGYLERLPDDWLVGIIANAQAGTYFQNDTRLYNASGTWRGDPRDGHLSFQGRRDADDLTLHGEVTVRQVNDKWEVETRYQTDVFQEIRLENIR